MASGTSIRALTGVRAVAAAMVFFFHACPALLRDDAISMRIRALWPVEFGWTGVNLFFALSGFLFAWLYVPLEGDNALSETRTWAPFWRKRFARIMPLYGLVLGIACVLSQPSIADTLSHVLLVHNYFSDYRFSVSSPFWSLAVEVHFYLLFPVIASFAPTYKNISKTFAVRTLWLVMICLAFREVARISADLKAGYTSQYDSNLWASSVFGRFSDFGFGMLSAWFCTWAASRNLRFAPLVSMVLGIATLLGCASFIEDHGGVHMAARSKMFALVGVAIAAGYAMIFAWLATSRWAEMFLGNRTLVALGESSYGLYLVQALLIDHTNLVARSELLLHNRVPYAATAALMFSYITAAAVAHALYLFWEKPVQRWLLGHKKATQEMGGAK